MRVMHAAALFLLFLSVPLSASAAESDKGVSLQKAHGKISKKSATSGSELPNSERHGEMGGEAPDAVVSEDLARQAKDVIAEGLLDPEAAKFRRLTHIARETINGVEQIICGEFNGKNAYGAYTGYKRFIVQDGKVAMREDEAELPAIADGFWKILCAEGPAKTIKWRGPA